MDKIFKNKFDTFEPPVPEELYGNIINQINQETAFANTKSPSKIWIYGLSAVILACLTALILLSKENDKVTKFEQALKLNENSTPNNTEVISESTPTESITNTKSTKETVKCNHGLKTDNKTKDNSKSKETPIKNKQEKEFNTLKNNEIPIISAQRYTCNHTCVLELNKAIDGEWITKSGVNIQKVNDKVYHVNYPNLGAVLFTYKTATQKDTFTVFFRNLAQITPNVIAENCNNTDGAVIINCPKNIGLTSLNQFEINNNRINNLESGVYKLKFQDQYGCQYSETIEVPKKQIDVNIKDDALHYKVGYPIYFTAKTEQEGLTYNWNFGDGNESSDQNTENHFTQAGDYTILLEINSPNCPTQTIEKTIHIDSKPIEIPNIFTPNNDGQNDEFFVKLPDGTLSFEASIFTTQGQLVYKWTDENKAWDGRWQNGQEAKTGHYLYILQGKKANNRPFEYKSVINLIR